MKRIAVIGLVAAVILSGCSADPEEVKQEHRDAYLTSALTAVPGSTTEDAVITVKAFCGFGKKGKAAAAKSYQTVREGVVGDTPRMSSVNLGFTWLTTAVVKDGVPGWCPEQTEMWQELLAEGLVE